MDRLLTVVWESTEWWLVDGDVEFSVDGEPFLVLL